MVLRTPPGPVTVEAQRRHAGARNGRRLGAAHRSELDDVTSMREMAVLRQPPGEGRGAQVEGRAAKARRARMGHAF